MKEHDAPRSYDVELSFSADGETLFFEAVPERRRDDDDHGDGVLAVK